ncbi:AraC family transcriptional regulator [Flavobacterium cerinum]|uniref:AraC family transcriptional regulator n=1 Tax=Flavobacterium cerinum TaxID=2502784 RepID=A0A444GMC4_9FLAO|nr:helix-turn-helix domain-containing protein [Flavobacterium cerinum]RWW92132.1 AraC family transcriptional regulator [Flavobacterium cerinum]
MQIAPSPSLQHIVRHYLILSNNVGTNPDFRMFSDGSPGIVFHRKAPLRQKSGKDGNLTIQPECFVYGQITQFNTLSAASEMDMLIVVLQPSALFKLFAVPAFEVTNETISFTDLAGQSGRILIDQVQNYSGNNIAITAIEDFLLKRLLKHSYSDKIISMSLQQIYAQKGMNTITETLKDIPSTERQLERKFREHIGLSPKKFADIIKFQHLLKNMKHISPTLSLSDVSYISGYYDQSHLNNSFKKFTGLTPLQYLINNNLLAVNFLALQ